jgi:superfamily II DNA/RNA helicase
VLLLYSASQVNAYGALIREGSPTADRIVGRIGMDQLTAMSPGSKLCALIEWLGDFLEGGYGKVIVFASFARLFRFLREVARVPHGGISREEWDALRHILSVSLFFEGGMSDPQADATIRAFTTDPRYRILFATEAGAEGLNLQVASAVVHFDEPLSLGSLRQREGRSIRLGQDKHVLVATFRFAPAKELSSLIESRAARFVDPRLRALLIGKGVEQSALLSGIART